MLLGVSSKNQEKIKDDWESLMNENKFYLRKMKKMKQENKKLVELHNLVSVQANADNEELQSFIKKLEEEIKKLKEELDEENERTIELIDEKKKLREENKQQKEDLLYYRFYAYTLDRSGDCDLTKEDVDYFTDDEAKRKTLYERIGYEEEDYKSFGVMFVDADDEDEDDIDFFDTEEEAQKLMNDIISSNTTSPHPYPEGKLILFRSHKYNPDYDNSGTVPILREMEIGTDIITNLDSLLGQLKKRTKFLENARK